MQLSDTTETIETTRWEHNNLKLFPGTSDHSFVSYHIFCTWAQKFWILNIFRSEVLLSNHQKFWLTWLMNENLFWLRYWWCSIQAWQHFLDEAQEDLLPTNDCWAGAPDTLPQEKVYQHETGWDCVVVGGGELLQSHKSCARQSSQWKLMQCCLGSHIWWGYEI